MRGKPLPQLLSYERGIAFQEEIRRGWQALGAGNWRLRLRDGRGGTQPADELILLDDVNILAEHKRTKKAAFALEFLRPDQFKGLLAFDRVLHRNRGLVCVSFLDEKKGLDEAYAFRLVTAVRYLGIQRKGTITLQEFQQRAIPCELLPLLGGAGERTYDLEGLVKCCRSL